MNEEMRNILKQFICSYKKAVNKEAFIEMWEQTLSIPDEPLTLKDAYNEAYGNALIQLYANEEDWG